MSFYGRFLREVACAGLTVGAGPLETVRRSQLVSLPEPAQRYAEYMGVVDRPQDWSFRLGSSGRFRTKPDQPWMKCEAWQYSSRPAVARIFHIRIRFGGLVPVIGRDTYLRGRGRMLVKLLDLFTIEDGMGDEYDTGELVTYLNDAVMIAPSMLFVREISFSPVDANSFALSLTDHGRTVTARVTVDKNGAPKDFSTTGPILLRPQAPEQADSRALEHSDGGRELVDGRRRPLSLKAVWHLPQEPFAYADFRLIPGSLVFDVPPGL